jgi:hypothetical protein
MTTQRPLDCRPIAAWLGPVLMAGLLGACSEIAWYEGMRTQQQKDSQTNRSSTDPLPPYDQFKKERETMRPADGPSR